MSDAGRISGAINLLKPLLDDKKLHPVTRYWIATAIEYLKRVKG